MVKGVKGDFTHGLGGYRRACRCEVCTNANSEYNKAHRKRNSEWYKAYYKARNRKMREWVDELKNKPCMDCGGIFPPECMDFDHRDPSTKSFGIGARVGSQMVSKARFLEEIAKCDLVCSNCHRIRTKKQWK